MKNIILASGKIGGTLSQFFRENFFKYFIKWLKNA